MYLLEELMGSDPLNLGGLTPLISEASINAPLLEEDRLLSRVDAVVLVGGILATKL